jgi:hypothetical protein
MPESLDLVPTIEKEKSAKTFLRRLYEPSICVLKDSSSLYVAWPFRASKMGTPRMAY